MKILYLLPVFSFGGTERFLINLIMGHSNRFQVTLLTFRVMEGHFQRLPCSKVWLEDIGISKQDMDDIFSSKNPRLTITTARRLSMLVNQEKADLVVGVLHVSALLLAVARDFVGMKTPFIANLHGNASAYLQREVSNPLNRFISGMLVRYMCGRAHAVIVPSLGVRKDLIEHFGANPLKVNAIYNGMDLDMIRRRMGESCEYALRVNDSLVILGVGRLDTQKTFHVLISAFAEVVKHTPAKLVILGEGHERPRLEQLIASLGIQESVSLPGFVENPYAWMRQATVFCLSSAYEGLPFVLVEAMACGCPVVSTDCPSGPGEIIRHGENGMLVPVDNAIALADAIRRILLDGQFRDKLVLGGLARADDFAVPQMVNKYERVYQSAVQTAVGAVI